MFTQLFTRSFFWEKNLEVRRIPGDVSELQGDFALNQLESDLGGTRELETNFFPFPLPPGRMNRWFFYVFGNGSGGSLVIIGFYTWPLAQ